MDTASRPGPQLVACPSQQPAMATMTYSTYENRPQGISASSYTLSFLSPAKVDEQKSLLPKIPVAESASEPSSKLASRQISPRTSQPSLLRKETPPTPARYVPRQNSQPPPLKPDLVPNASALQPPPLRADNLPRPSAPSALQIPRQASQSTLQPVSHTIDFAAPPRIQDTSAGPLSAPIDGSNQWSPVSPIAKVNRYTLPDLLRRRSSTYLPVPSAENDYLNFCPGAWRLQTGDPEAFKPIAAGRWLFRRRKPIYECSENGCVFREMPSSGSALSTTTSCENLTKNWGNAARGDVIEQRGVRFRQSFLSKSHVSFGRAQDGLSRFQCMFCAFRGVFKFEVLVGVDALLAHVATHRKEAAALETKVLDRAQCIVNRRAADTEAFDVNLVPIGQALGEREDNRPTFADWARLKFAQENESEGDRLIRAISLSQIRREPIEKRLGFSEWIRAKLDEEHLRPTEWPGLA